MLLLAVRSFSPRTIYAEVDVDAVGDGGKGLKALGGRDSAICASARNLLAENGRKYLARPARLARTREFGRTGNDASSQSEAALVQSARSP